MTEKGAYAVGPWYCGGGMTDVGSRHQEHWSPLVGGGRRWCVGDPSIVPIRASSERCGPSDQDVEAAARALAEASDDGCFDGEEEDPEMFEAGSEDRDYYRRLARAALCAVLGKPDEASS